MAQRYSWPKVGWDTTVLPWLHDQLASYQIMAIEQFAVSDWSCILRIATEKGDLYLLDFLVTDIPGKCRLVWRS